MNCFEAADAADTDPGVFEVDTGTVIVIDGGALSAERARARGVAPSQRISAVRNTRICDPTHNPSYTLARMSDHESAVDEPERVQPTVRDALIGLGIGLLLVYVATWVPYGFVSWSIIGLGVLFIVVMSGFIIVSAWDKASPGIRRVTAKARGHVRQDPRLGTLTRNVKGEYWEGVFAAGDRRIELLVDGHDEPDPKLVARARELVADFDSVERRVQEFLAHEAKRESEPELAAQIAGLRVSALKFLSGKRGGRVDIEFKGPDEDLYWSCTYADGKPRDLWFDS